MDFLRDFYSDWKNVIVILAIIFSAFIITRINRWLFRKSFITASEKINIDPTRYKFFRNALSFLVWIIAIGAIIYTIPQFKAVAITLFAGAGIMVAIIGFAAQQAFSNIISGIFIVIFKPFRVDDMIKVGNLEYGLVEDITLRHTIIKNFENKRIIIPNSVISAETIINDNISDEEVCRWIEIGISYDSDIDLAIKIIQEEAEKHANNIDVRTKKEKSTEFPRVNVRLMSFGDSSINLRAYVWLKSALDGMQAHSDINYAIKKRFDNEGIEIPFPHRTIVYKNEKN